MNASRTPWIVAFVLSILAHGALLYWLSNAPPPADSEAGSGAGSAVQGSAIELAAGFAVPVDTVDAADAPPTEAPTPEVATAAPAETAPAVDSSAIDASSPQQEVAAAAPLQQNPVQAPPIVEAAPVTADPAAAPPPAQDAAAAETPAAAPAPEVQTVESADPTDALPSPPPEIAAVPEAAAAPAQPVADAKPAAPVEQQPVPTAEAPPVQTAAPVTQEIAAIEPPPLPAAKPDLPKPDLQKPVTEAAKPAPKEKTEPKKPAQRVVHSRRGQGTVDSSKGADVADGQSTARDSTIGSSRAAGSGTDSYSNYGGLVQQRIQREASSGRGARRRMESGTVVVKFVIDADGSVSSLVLASSSGISSLDDAALNAVRRAAPFPPPPGGRRPITQPMRFGLE